MRLVPEVEVRRERRNTWLVFGVLTVGIAILVAGSVLDRRAGHNARSEPALSCKPGEYVAHVRPDGSFNCVLAERERLGTIALLRDTDVVRLTPSRAAIVDGLHMNGARIVVVMNVSDFPVTLVGESAEALPVDRFSFGGSTSVAIPPHGSAQLRYCENLSRWWMPSITEFAFCP